MTGEGDGRAGAADVRPRGALLLLIGLALGGCDSLGLPEGVGGERPEAAAGPAPGAAATADVAAPELFQVAEAGLWDGRPSLGGVWVAHPGATDPERVRIVNRENGREVVGALFRRERDLPGPALQVSSDAAEALGMLAGAPTELEVTALRREAPAAPEPAAPEPTDPAAAEPPAVAELAAEASPAPAAVPAPADPAAVEAVAQATAAIVQGAAVAPAPGPGAIATTTLDGGPATPAAAPAQGFVQLARFDVEANAAEAARQLAAQGLPVRVLPAGGAWRLLLGPAATGAERDALLQAAVAAGFADAYLVSS